VTKKRDRKKKPESKPDQPVFRLTFGVRAVVQAEDEAVSVETFTEFLKDPRVKKAAVDHGIPTWQWKLANIEKQVNSDILRVRKQLLGPDEKPLRH